MYTTMIKRYAAVAIMSVLMALAGVLPARADRYTDYIEKYAGMAVEQQAIYGIPASITLAQALLESAAGRSTLATEGNNHFGIKCHSTWTGPTMLRDDDAPDECFRVYADAADSFKDHSIFLTRKRYAPLFELDNDDYAGWARTLRECGYATDPNYAERLIAIIERYGLQEYDVASGRQQEETAAFILNHLRQSHVVRKSRGLHFVIAVPGDTYGSLARELGIDKKKLLRYNDMEKDCPVADWEEVFLEEKLDEAPKGVKRVTIGERESIHSLSQRYGMKMSRIMELNPGVEDKPGKKLRLQ